MRRTTPFPSSLLLTPRLWVEVRTRNLPCCRQAHWQQSYSSILLTTPHPWPQYCSFFNHHLHLTFSFALAIPIYCQPHFFLPCFISFSSFSLFLFSFLYFFLSFFFLSFFSFFLSFFLSFFFSFFLSFFIYLFISVFLFHLFFFFLLFFTFHFTIHSFPIPLQDNPPKLNTDGMSTTIF